MRQRRSEDSTDDGDSTDDRPTPVDSESSEEAGRKTPLQRSGKGTPRRRKVCLCTTGAICNTIHSALTGLHPCLQSNPSVVVLPFVFAFAIVATAILAWFQFSPPAQETLVTPPTVGQATSTGGEAFGASGPTFATDASVSGPSPTDSVSRAGSTGVDEGTTSVPSGSPKHRTGEGLIGYEDERCGPSRAVHEVTQSSGPNGSQDWLNCGLSRSQPDAPWVRRGSHAQDLSCGTGAGLTDFVLLGSGNTRLLRTSSSPRSRRSRWERRSRWTSRCTRRVSLLFRILRSMRTRTACRRSCSRRSRCRRVSPAFGIGGRRDESMSAG